MRACLVLFGACVMSLSFDFPGWQWDENSQISSAKPADSLGDADRWQHDLDELSGAEDQQQQQQEEEEDFLQQPTEPQRKRACDENRLYSSKHDNNVETALSERYVPDAVIQLVADRLGLQDIMAMARCCKAWHECLVVDSSDIWEQQEKDLFGENASRDAGRLLPCSSLLQGVSGPCSAPGVLTPACEVHALDQSTARPKFAKTKGITPCN